MRKAAALLLLTALATTACGSRVAPLASQPQRGLRAAPGTASASGPTSGEAGAGAVATSTAAPAGRTGGGAEPSPLPSGLAGHSNMPLKVTLDRTCARLGDPMTAVAETLPGSALVFATQYPDNQQVPDWYYLPKESNPTGTFTWRWVIPPTQRNGDSLLIVVASRDGKGATFNAPFRIADSC